MGPAPGMTVLSQEDLDHFSEKGYVILHDCFSKEQAAYWLKDVWVRLGMNPNDKSTWSVKPHMPVQRTVKIKEFSPKAWGGICDLIGGEDKVHPNTQYWRDNFIVNLGDSSTESMESIPQQLTNWHCDGDTFNHFLDSPDQALVVTPIWSDEIKHGGGATFIAPDSIAVVAKYLADHPEGVMPGPTFGYLDLIKECKEFVELTGKVGQVILMHCLTLHSASHNSLRIPRFITNPGVIRTVPYRFDLPEDQLCPVEKKTLKALGKTSYKFEIKGERLRFRGGRYELWNKMHNAELARLKVYGTAEHFMNDPLLSEFREKGILEQYIGGRAGVDQLRPDLYK